MPPQASPAMQRNNARTRAAFGMNGGSRTADMDMLLNAAAVASRLQAMAAAPGDADVEAARQAAIQGALQATEARKLRDAIRGDIQAVKRMPRDQVLAAQGMQEGPAMPPPVRVLSQPEAAAMAAAEIQAQAMRFNPQQRQGPAVQNLPQALMRVPDANGNPSTRWNPDVLAAAGVSQADNDRNLTTSLQGQREARRRIGITDDMTPQQMAAANANLQQQAAKRAAAFEAAKAERMAKVNQVSSQRDMLRRVAGMRQSGQLPPGVSDQQAIAYMSGAPVNQAFAGMDPSAMWKMAEISLQQQQLAEQRRQNDIAAARQAMLDKDTLANSDMNRRVGSLSLAKETAAVADVMDPKAAADRAFSASAASDFSDITDPSAKARAYLKQAGLSVKDKEDVLRAYRAGTFPWQKRFELGEVPTPLLDYMRTIYDNDLYGEGLDFSSSETTFEDKVMSDLRQILPGVSDNFLRILAESYYESR